MCIEVTVVGEHALRVRVVGTSYWNNIRPGQADVFPNSPTRTLPKSALDFVSYPDQSRYPAFNTSVGKLL